MSRKAQRGKNNRPLTRPMRARVHSRCSKTGKQRYYDQLEAMIALQSTFQTDKGKRQERRFYRCPFCRGWHLTSQELRLAPTG